MYDCAARRAIDARRNTCRILSDNLIRQEGGEFFLGTGLGECGAYFTLNY